MNELNKTETLEESLEPAEEIKDIQSLAETTFENRQFSANHERWILFLIAGSVILLDQVTKYLVQNSLPVYTYWAPVPAIENFFRITHTTNTGVAFGLFPDGNTIFAVFAIVVSIAIIYYNQTLSPGHPWLRVALGLQMGGALGNFISRLYPGHVVDFLDFGPWPIFNIADIAVVSGTVLLAWIMLQEERAQQTANKDVYQPKTRQDENSNLVIEPAADQTNESPTN